MGKFSSSSRQGKPHYVISIRASLALLAGGVFSLTFLHANETEGEISFEISPQLESPSIPFVVVEKDELKANFESGQSEMSFEMTPSVPKLHQSQSSFKKSSHFQDKKEITFSGEIQANQSYFSSASNLDDSASSANGAIHPSKEASKLTPKQGPLSNEFASKAYPSAEMGLSFDEGSFDELLEISVDEKKMQFNEVPSFNSRDFHPTVWVESIGLAEEKSSFKPVPVKEKASKERAFKSKKINLDLSCASSKVFLDENWVSLSTLSKEDVQFLKHQQKEQIFDANALSQIPYFDLLVTQEEEEAHPYFSPNKEKAEILFETSEVAPLSLSHDFKEENVSFSLPPQQGIASAEIDFKCPKSDLEYETSHLEIHSTYLPIHNGKPQDAVAALPELEEHIEAKVFEKDLKLDSLSSRSRSIFELNVESGEGLALIQEGLEFPSGKISSTLTELSLEKTPYVASKVDGIKKETSFSPSFEMYTPTFLDSHVKIQLEEVPSDLFALSIPKGNELSLIDENIPAVKGDIQERLAISLYGVRLPNVKNKAVQGQKDGGKKTSNDFKGIEEVIARKEPTQAEKIESLVPLIDHLHTPHRPSYYPPNSLNLDILDTHISMLDKNLDYSHKLHTTPPETSSQNAPSLPYLSSKHISPSKHAFNPEFAFNDLPMPNLIMELATRDIQFPNAKSLLQNSAAPSYIPSEVMISSVPIEDLNTSDITSQSKEILRDYDQKNIEDLGYLALKDEVEPVRINEKDVRTVNTSSRLTQGFLGEIPPPSHLNTVTYREQFDTEVHFAKNEDGNGYMFALKMKPKPSLETCDESKNIIFVIDGSSTIKKDRFETFKEGTLRSLKYLNPNDTFNILVADAKVIPLGKTSTRANGAGKAQAKQFLNERKYRGFFIDYDPFDLLENVTNYLDLEKDNVIVLLSDGHGFQNIKAHLEDFQELREASKGRYSIFAATASRGNNLSMLDVLTTFNKGELTYSKTHTAFPRSLAVMVRHINSLVAKDVQIHVTRARQDANIEFYPNNNTLPSLYSDRAYTIYGTIKEPKDFDIILQGRTGDTWVNIKQHISFKDAQNASMSIKKGFALQKAYVCYDYFISGEDPFFLVEAERILNPLSIPTAAR